MKATTLSISLPPELARYVRDKVGTGNYASVSEVIREALRLLQAEQGQALEFDQDEAERAIDAIRRARVGVQLGGDLTISDLINEGRR
ncbi:MAG: type II toxin-antitoxin system ParD family antitoxin [Planctomycetota bacterium]